MKEGMRYRLIAAEQTSTGSLLIVEHLPAWWEFWEKSCRREYVEVEGKWHIMPAMKVCSGKIETILSDLQARVR